MNLWGWAHPRRLCQSTAALPLMPAQPRSCCLSTSMVLTRGAAGPREHLWFQNQDTVLPGLLAGSLHPSRAPWWWAQGVLPANWAQTRSFWKQLPDLHLHRHRGRVALRVLQGALSEVTADRPLQPADRGC